MASPDPKRVQNLDLMIDWADTAEIAVLPVNQVSVQRFVDPLGDETVSLTLGYAVPTPGTAFISPDNMEEYLKKHPVKVQHAARFALTLHSAKHLLGALKTALRDPNATAEAGE